MWHYNYPRAYWQFDVVWIIVKICDENTLTSRILVVSAVTQHRLSYLNDCQHAYVRENSQQVSYDYLLQYAGPVLT